MHFDEKIREMILNGISLEFLWYWIFVARTSIMRIIRQGRFYVPIAAIQRDVFQEERVYVDFEQFYLRSFGSHFCSALNYCNICFSKLFM